jgi:hypothetical protein
MSTVRRRTIKRSILKLLQEAPATAPELGAILFPRMKMRQAMRRASAHLCYLRTDGKVKVIGQVPREGHKADSNMANLYAIAA